MSSRNAAQKSDSAETVFEDTVRTYLSGQIESASLYNMLVGNLAEPHEIVENRERVDAAVNALVAFDEGRFRTVYNHLKTRRANVLAMLERPKHPSTPAEQHKSHLESFKAELVQVDAFLETFDEML